MDLQQPPVSRFNPELSCTLCAGYLVHCVTILDCQHHFCRSCLVKHFQCNTHCPICKTEVHGSHPLNYIRLDRHFQEVVNKMVPGLATEEEQIEADFYEKSGIVREKKVTVRESRAEIITRKSTRKGKVKPAEITLPLRTRKARRRNLDKQPVELQKSSSSRTSNSETNAGASASSNLNGNGNENENGIKNDSVNGNSDSPNSSCDTPANGNGHGQMISLILEHENAAKIKAETSSQALWLAAKFVRCASNAPVRTVKRFLALKLFDDATRFDVFDLNVCNDLSGQEKDALMQTDNAAISEEKNFSNGSSIETPASLASSISARVVPVPLNDEMLLSEVRRLLLQSASEVGVEDDDKPVTLVYKLAASFESTDL